MQKNKFVHEDIKAVCNSATKRLVAMSLAASMSVGGANFAAVSYKNIACAQTGTQPSSDNKEPGDKITVEQLLAEFQELKSLMSNCVAPIQADYRRAEQTYKEQKKAVDSLMNEVTETQRKQRFESFKRLREIADMNRIEIKELLRTLAVMKYAAPEQLQQLQEEYDEFCRMERSYGRLVMTSESFTEALQKGGILKAVEREIEDIRKIREQKEREIGAVKEQLKCADQQTEKVLQTVDAKLKKLEQLEQQAQENPEQHRILSSQGYEIIKELQQMEADLQEEQKSLVDKSHAETSAIYLYYEYNPNSSKEWSRSAARDSYLKKPRKFQCDSVLCAFSLRHKLDYLRERIRDYNRRLEGGLLSFVKYSQRYNQVENSLRPQLPEPDRYDIELAPEYVEWATREVKRLEPLARIMLQSLRADEQEQLDFNNRVRWLSPGESDLLNYMAQTHTSGCDVQNLLYEFWAYEYRQDRIKARVDFIMEEKDKALKQIKSLEKMMPEVSKILKNYDKKRRYDPKSASREALDRIQILQDQLDLISSDYYNEHTTDLCENPLRPRNNNGSQQRELMAKPRKNDDTDTRNNMNIDMNFEDEQYMANQPEGEESPRNNNESPSLPFTDTRNNIMNIGIDLDPTLTGIAQNPQNTQQGQSNGFFQKLNPFNLFGGWGGSK